VAAGPGGGPHVKVYDGVTFDLIRSFFAYGGDFHGGVSVASADVNGDGLADIITGAGLGGGPHVRVFSGLDGSVITEFFAFGAGFHGGVNVASADVNGDGLADIVVGAGAGGGPHVRILSGLDLSVLSEFFAYDAGFRGGVNVAAGDVNGDGFADVITGPASGGTPHIKVFNGGTGDITLSFMAFNNISGSSQLAADWLYRGGARITTVDADGDGVPDIIA